MKVKNNKKTILVLPPPNFEKTNLLIQLVNWAAQEASQKLNVDIGLNYSHLLGHNVELRNLYSDISDADLIIADISPPNENTLYKIGIADALKKPAIILSYIENPIPFEISQRRIILYDRSENQSRTIISELTKSIINAYKSPDIFKMNFNIDPKSKQIMPKVFISYSHADKKCLERLLVHLRPLVRDNILEVWADIEIKAGDKWKDSIQSALDDAAIAILLISADFLASDFIVENELQPLLANAEKGGTRILPLILKPCLFDLHQNLHQFQAINQPTKPLLNLSEIEQEEWYTKVARIVEQEIRSRK